MMQMSKERALECIRSGFMTGFVDSSMGKYRRDDPAFNAAYEAAEDDRLDETGVALWGQYIWPGGSRSLLGEYHKIKANVEKDGEWVYGRYEFAPIDPAVARWLHRNGPFDNPDIDNLRKAMA